MVDSDLGQFGDYRLLSKLAQGGMAEIFLAENPAGELCALKRILPHLAHQENFIRMFIDEARIVSQLIHPNITAVTDQGKHEGYYYIAMEFVQGHSLLAFAERAKASRMSLPMGLLAYVVAELLSGLGYAHHAQDKRGRPLGIVHRDVTPQNVLISYQGEVKLIDFGVAKARARLTQTEAGFTKGKLAYMSPEQARGEEIDGRSDLFSVGIVLYELTTATRLFNKEGPGGILSAIVNDPIPSPRSKVSNYPKALEAIVMRALAKDLNHRWQEAEDMRQALLRFAASERPPPGSTRLAELLHDLMGPPASQAVVRAFREERSKSVLGAAQPFVEPKRGRGDETRVLLPDEAPSPYQEASRVEITSDGVPVVLPGPDQDSSADLPSQAAIEVPEPDLPRRVAFAQALRDRSDAWSALWRRRRAAILGVFFGLIMLLGGLGAWVLGGSTPDSEASKVEDATEATHLDDPEGSTRSASGAQASAIPKATPQGPPTLRLESDPPGAAIAIDGIGLAEVTPYQIRDLRPNARLHLELRLPGYQPFQTEIKAPARGELQRRFQLIREAGSLWVESDPPGAEIWVNGRRSGERTPAVLKDLPSGKLKVTLRLKGYQRAESEIKLADGDQLKLSFPLVLDEAQLPGAEVEIKSRPPGCEVFLKNRRLGTTPLNSRLRPGEHQLRLRCKYHHEAVRDLWLMPGESQKLEVQLEPSAFGYLSLSVTPEAGSRVTLNGQRVRLPIRFLKVVPGRHAVQVENRGLGKTKRFNVNIGPNQNVARRVNLTR